MARGKKSLLETSDLPVVYTDEEKGQIPYFLIDDEWGVSCDERQEILVKKKIANKTVKDENGENEHIEQYTMWDSICYPSTFTDAINSYVKKKSRSMKSKIYKSSDYKDILNVQNEIKSIVAKSLDTNGVNKNFLSITSIINERQKIEEELQMLRDVKEQVNNECEKLMELIKEKRSIIIKNTEPKKHRMPKED